MGDQRLLVQDAPKDGRFKTLDVICAGEALWQVEGGAGALSAEVAAMRFRPGGGAVNAALALARQGLRVGLATVLADDTYGRALAHEIAAAGVDTGGIDLARPSNSLVLLRGRGGARQVVSYREEEQPVSVPEGWSSQVLLLSGMSPVIAHGAALCRAARAARRAGALVVVDVNVRWHLWEGRDPRVIRMVLREADVVWCSAEDLFGLKMDLATVRAALRPTAVLAVTDGTGSASATGPFGELARASRRTTGPGPIDDDDAFAVAICSELARAGQLGEGRSDLWTRALTVGYAAAGERNARR